jgi:APA family basic amino acid/polyamine antiporter
MRSTFSPATAASIVIANMIGTGVFTSLGFQLLEFTSPALIIALWVIGGVLALCGALCYAELGAALPRSGGEYNFLGQLYHPAAGFVSGWISATIGFAAPTALAAITFGTYLGAVLPGLSPTWAAASLICLTGLMHAASRDASGRFQLAATAVKVLLITLFVCAAPVLAGELQPLRWQFDATTFDQLFTAGFAVSLIYVNYAYTGWNAATYLSGELAQPQRVLPWVLTLGTLLVMLLYVALNTVFLYVAPADAMAGKVEVGHIAASHAFGTAGGDAMGLVLALLLVSTVSAMVLAGPRVLQVIGEDFPALGFLKGTTPGGVPRRAILVQCGVSLLLVFTAAFDTILLFTGFTLALNTLAAVCGVFLLRRRGMPMPFTMPLYPWPPLVFIAITTWTMVYLLIERPAEALWGLGIVLAGSLFWAASRSRY